MHIGDFGVIATEVEAANATPDSPVELDTFAFYGQEIRLRPFIGVYPMMRFATLVTSSAYSTSIGTLSILNKTLEACVLPADWAKFQQLADANSTDLDTLNKLIEQLYLTWCARPTVRPSDSSDGPQIDETGPDSSGKSSGSSRASKRAGSSNPQELATATG